MRREGRLHGTNVRVNKKEYPGYLQKASNKPTNHSKISSRCPGNKVRCPGCSNGFPVKKSIGKVKKAFKARDLDVTRNHKMHEWSFSQKQRWGGPCGEESDDERPSWDSDEIQEYWEDEPARSPKMVCPIECLVQMRKPSSARALQQPAAAACISEMLVIQSAMIDSDDGWSDFDFSDGEDAVADDWVFVTELA